VAVLSSTAGESLAACGFADEPARRQMEASRSITSRAHDRLREASFDCRAGSSAKPQAARPSTVVAFGSLAPVTPASIECRHPMAKLSVNVNKIATLRNTRALDLPSVVGLSRVALAAGAHGITVHPRPDHRHIRPADVYALADLLRTEFPAAEFNIEGNPFFDYVHFARDVRPTQCTLVPDSPEAATSDHGWDVVREAKRLGPVIAELKGYGCRVSLFVDADPAVMRPAADLGADRVELYTEPYAAAFARGDARAVEPYAAAAAAAAEAGLGVNAGHDLNLDNLPPLVARLPNLLEVSIGHALIGDALELGLAETVRRYLAAAGTVTVPPAVLVRDAGRSGPP
jgi:pyridoxine 5-phosphate synthase